MTDQDRNTLRQRLVTLLVNETQQLSAFISVLQQEQDILMGQNVEPLYDLAKQKASFARQLQQLATSRATVLAQAKLTLDRNGVESLLAGKHTEIWKNYLELATQARQLNQDNGVAITSRLSFNHQALAILLAHSDQPTVYGPDGTSRAKPGSRHFGSF